MMVVDFHSHVLPGIDDGSRSTQEAVAMLRESRAQGIEHMVATPHFYANHDNLERFLARRAESESRLREAMEQDDGLPQLHIGAEVHYFSGMAHSELLSSLTIDHKNCILIEMPNGPWSDAMYQELEEIYFRQDLTPVIAHVDRYLRPFRTRGIPERLEQLPVLVQANADFFLERRTRNMALRMLQKGQIHLLGSDCHNLLSRRPNLGQTVRIIQKQLGDGALSQIHSFEQKVLLETAIKSSTV